MKVIQISITNDNLGEFIKASRETVSHVARNQPYVAARIIAVLLNLSKIKVNV